MFEIPSLPDLGDRRTNYACWGLLCILFVLAFLFRFTNLDRRLYWHDEAYTSLMAAGYSSEEVVAEISNGSKVSSQDLLKYQQPTPEKSILDTIQSTARSDPHHPLVYYLLSRIWMFSVGYSPAAMRSLAALISLLALPAMYWLSYELFGSRRTALLAAALIGISPIHILLAREAREYSLWTVSTLVSTAALLRALRLKSKAGWILYASAAAFGLYSHLLFAVVLVVHVLYMLINIQVHAADQILSVKPLQVFLFAVLVAMIVFAPWIYVVLNNYRVFLNSTNWLNVQIPFADYLGRLAARYSGAFVDFDPFPAYVQLIFILPIFTIVSCSLFFLWKKGLKEVRSLIFLLIGVTAVSLMLPDLVIGGRRFVVGRYLIPCFIGIQLAVAYFLASRLSSAKLLQRRTWQIVTVALFSVSILSNFLIVQAYSWWDKGSDYGHHQIIRTLNDADRALLIVDRSVDNFGTILGFSHALDPYVHIKWGNFAANDIRGEYSEIFFFRPSAATQNAVAALPNTHLEQVISNLLWCLAENYGELCIGY